MILLESKAYIEEQYESENQFEETVWELREAIFGRNRLYFDIKKRIGEGGKIQNIPDGYLLDLSSQSTPKVFVVENELAIHGQKHIAMQLLEFSISYDNSKQKIKNMLRQQIIADKTLLSKVDKYISSNNFQNIDYLLDKALDVQKNSDISVIVVIDQIDSDLEKALREKLRFPIEIITLVRFKNDEKYCYMFEPFMSDVISDSYGKIINRTLLDVESVDTIVVPAQEEGFKETFLGEDRWYAIRINELMIPRIKYIAAYQVSPISAITYWAEVASIEPWGDSGKYVVNFKEKAKKIGPINLVQKGKVKALQNSRYTAFVQLNKVNNLDELWS